MIRKYWKSKFKDVIKEITYFNADDIVCEYFSNETVRVKDLDIDIINCWFYLEDNKFKQYMINNILHILKANNHRFYNELEYYLLWLTILVSVVVGVVLDLPHLVRTSINKHGLF